MRKKKNVATTHTHTHTKFGRDTSYPAPGVHIVGTKDGGRVMKAAPRHRGGGKKKRMT